MSLRFRIIQLKRNKFAKISIGTFIVLLLLLALYKRSENIQNSHESPFPKHSRFSNQVSTYIYFIIHMFICKMFTEHFISSRYQFTVIKSLVILSILLLLINRVPEKKVNLIMFRVTEKMKHCNLYLNMA